MSITRTYASGQQSRVRRLDNHTGPWIDISIPDPNGIAFECVDVKASPNDTGRVGVVGPYYGQGSRTGIVISHDAGATWFSPIGTWTASKEWVEIWWVDDNVVWAVGDNGLVAISTDGGLRFDLTPSLPFDPSAARTTCIHALDDRVAVVAGNELNNLTNAYTIVWKTIDGGNSWTKLNGGSTLVNTLPTGTPIGQAHSIAISPDQQTIIVGSSYHQHITTNGGFSFGDWATTADEFTRSGRHLTWYPSYGGFTHLKHVGGSTEHVDRSNDGGATWVITRSGEGIVIRGAHFYSENNGYYVVGGETFFTSDGGITGTLSDPVSATQIDLMYAVWTSEFNTTICLTSCLDPTVILYVLSANTLDQYIGQVIQASFDGYDDLCWEVGECPIPTDLVADAGQPVIDGVFDTCEDCIPQPESICYDLISCNGTCTDILGANQIPFIDSQQPIVPGSLWYINGNSDCIYEVYPLRQAIFRNVQTDNLSNPAGDFQNGLDDRTITIGSLIFNGVEQVVTPFNYILTPANYQVVECTGLTCNIVPFNTTENCVDNTQIFFNSVFSSLGLPLEAYSDDPNHCGFGCGGKQPGTTGCDEMFRVQYRDGDTFTITLTVTSNAGTGTFLLTVDSSNVSLQSNVEQGISLEVCNENVYCVPSLQPIIDDITAWDGECPIIPGVPPTQPDLGEACEITPRIGEPGFSFKNCDPKEVINVKTNFAESVYALFKRMKYGIETCCEFDLDKIDVKNLLLDLGKLYDPDLCVDGTPIPDACCPQPCNAIATLVVPLWLTCPAPTNAITDIQLPVILAPELCLPPTGPNGANKTRARISI